MTINYLRKTAAAGEYSSEEKSFRLKGFALDEGVDEFADRVLLAPRCSHDFVREVFVNEAKEAAQGVLDEVFGEAASKVGFALGDEVAEFIIVREGGALVESAGGVDRQGVSADAGSASRVPGELTLFTAPLAGGGEVL